MIVYILTKNTQSNLSNIQTRLWREFAPQAEVMKLQTDHWNVVPVVNRILNWMQSIDHRYALMLHEDCLPLKQLDIPELLNGRTFACRMAPDGEKPHPSRTWMAVDKTIEGMTAQPYGERPLTRDDVNGHPVIDNMQYLEPGFLHIDSWYKLTEDDPRRIEKRDWLLDFYEEYVKLPPLTTRVFSFASAAVTHVGAGLPHVKKDEWLQRQRICRGCDYFRDGRCGHCGCGILTKSRWRGQTCPIGLWPDIEEPMETENAIN